MLGISIVALGIVGAVAALTLWILSLRRIVPPNDMHILTTNKAVRSFGKDQDHGSVYYAWPSWIPVIGVYIEELSIANFELELKNYDAYDKDRVPFKVDIVAFFRITDTNKAAQRVENFQSLQHQISEILRGACRNLLAESQIDKIMLERSEFGKRFTEKVGPDLEAWGVSTVKTIELMDIRDAEGEKVIFNIMEKRRSFIEKESRIEVADNMQLAETAEIEAKQTVEVRDQEALQAIGERTAMKDREIGVANENAKQEIKTQEKVTKEREMAVVRVAEVKSAEIIREKAVVKADEDKQTAVIRAEGEKTQTVLVSEGALTEQQNTAIGIEAVGLAEGKAEEAILMAPVTANITLAKEIGANEGYQSYLQVIENVGAYKAVGVASAEALVSSDLKIIVNAGDIGSGVTNVLDIFSTQGGTKIAGMMEALKQSNGGQALLGALGIKEPSANDAIEATAKVSTGTIGKAPKRPRSDVVEDTAKEIAKQITQK